ncbi:hypothetical protein DFP72DRAFT_866331 [Ephemerocybe angulata]|uniref:Uncharacterized protein n=1 Tax=Ephemerocybe angulata TaxID=980116 RepID=A0A8H6ILD1_9AGAR|nr:hypothetical protein DFP72DRAFT_866331 [Tulosesus angulatus]
MNTTTTVMKKAAEEPAVSGPSYKFEALLFSSIDSSLGIPLSLTHPTRNDTKPHHEARRSRQDSRASHRSSIHRSSSIVFRALPPIRRMPSLQVPSLTDISNPHNIPNPRSLNQISETEATAEFKLKLPLTLVHPNSPYVPWDPPVRQKILCAVPVSPPDDSTDDDESDPSDDAKSWRGGAAVWNALKSAPKKVKTKCRRFLNPRVRDPQDIATGESAGASSHTSRMALTVTTEDIDQIVSYVPQYPHASLPLSPTASFRSAETHSLAVWLSERQRKFLEKDCESSKLMTIDQYERVGSWIKPGDFPSFSASRTSYQYSFVSDHGDAVSAVLTVFESEGDLSPGSPMSVEHFPTPQRTSSPSASRAAFGPKRIMEEDRLSRIVHRASLLSYIAERPLSTANDWTIPSSP